jgi:hypothetical protein
VRGVQAFKGSEEPLVLLRRESRSGVLDSEAESIIGPVDSINPDQSSLKVVFDGIGKEIDEHLFEALTVCPNMTASEGVGVYG